MARSYRPVARDQAFLLPPSMAEWLREDHLAWFVLDVVDQLDTAGFHASRKTGRQGREGYDPDMLLALLIYAYAVGERSSRQIERKCCDDVAFRVLCAQDGPDHSTIARFRAENRQAFEDLFSQVLRLCAQAGMVKVGTISIDGTKIAANASRSANRSPQWVRERASRLAAEVVAEAEETDAAEDSAQASGGEDGGGGSGLPPSLGTRSGRAKNIKRALDELDRRDAADAAADAGDQARIEKALDDMRAGVTKMGRPPAGMDPVRWNQARIDAATRLLAEMEGIAGNKASWRRKNLRSRIAQAQAAKTQAEEAGPEAFDRRVRAARVRERRRRDARRRGAAAENVNVTDPQSRLMTEGSGGGSIQGYNAQVAVSDDHLIVGVHLSQDPNDQHCWIPTLAAATRQTEAVGKTIDLVLADAGYFTEENLTAPGPDRLIAPGTNRQLHTGVSEEPVSGPPPPGARPTEAMRYRVRDPDNAERYKRRGATVETVIAHLKDRTGLRRLAQRGIANATAELHLAAAVVNLSRLHNRGLAAT